MQKKTIILIAAAVLLAALGVMGVTQVVREEKSKVVEEAKVAIETVQKNQAAVLVAKKSIPKGVLVTPDMLNVSIVPKNYIQPQAVTSADRVAGMVTVVPIDEGDQITLNKLVFQKSTGALSEVTPRGKRAISIQVDNMASLAGMIKAGDYVDVIAILAIPMSDSSGKASAQPSIVPLFQNVKVLAVGKNIGGASKDAPRYQPKEDSADPNAPVTLALTSQEAGIVAFVQEQGKIRLMLRSPSDSEIEPMQITTWDALFRYLTPPEKQQEQQAAAAAMQAEKDAQKAQAPAGYVEVYRGMNKEKVPISQ